MYIASMISNIVEEELPSPLAREAAMRRRRIINQEKEMVNVQKELMLDHHSDDTTSRDFTKLWSADRLLDLAIHRAQQQSDINDKVAKLMLGLAACTTFDNINQKRESATSLWVEVVAMDLEFWNEHVTGQSDAIFGSMTSLVLDTTVFGGLLKELDNEPDESGEWKYVSYESVEALLLERWQEIDRQLTSSGLNRLLSITNRALRNNKGVEMMD